MTTIEEINALHDELMDIGRKTLEKAIRIGGLLTSEKNKLEQGEWLSWLKANISFNKRTAQRYMNLYKNRNSDVLKNDTLTLAEAYAALIDKRKTEEQIDCIKSIFQLVKQAKLCEQVKDEDISRLPAYIPIIKQFVLELERLCSPEASQYQFVEPVEDLIESLKKAA